MLRYCDRISFLGSITPVSKDLDVCFFEKNATCYPPVSGKNCFVKMSRLIWGANILLSSTVLITQYQLIKWGFPRKPSKLALRILYMVKQKK
jgi:hypothetical protein